MHRGVSGGRLLSAALSLSLSASPLALGACGREPTAALPERGVDDLPDGDAEPVSDPIQGSPEAPGSSAGQPEPASPPEPEQRLDGGVVSDSGNDGDPGPSAPPQAMDAGQPVAPEPEQDNDAGEAQDAAEEAGQDAGQQPARPCPDAPVRPFIVASGKTLRLFELDEETVPPTVVLRASADVLNAGELNATGEEVEQAVGTPPVGDGHRVFALRQRPGTNQIFVASNDDCASSTDPSCEPVARIDRFRLDRPADGEPTLNHERITYRITFTVFGVPCDMNRGGSCFVSDLEFYQDAGSEVSRLYVLERNTSTTATGSGNILAFEWNPEWGAAGGMQNVGIGARAYGSALAIYPAGLEADRYTLMNGRYPIRVVDEEGKNTKPSRVELRASAPTHAQWIPNEGAPGEGSLLVAANTRSLAAYSLQGFASGDAEALVQASVSLAGGQVQSYARSDDATRIVTVGRNDARVWSWDPSRPNDGFVELSALEEVQEPGLSQYGALITGACEDYVVATYSASDGTSGETGGIRLLHIDPHTDQLTVVDKLDLGGPTWAIEELSPAD